MADIRTAMAVYVTHQSGLSITDPVTLSIDRAYTWMPNPQQTLQAPAWVNEASLESYSRRPGGARHQHWTIHSLLLVDDPDLARGHEIAAEFLEQFFVALDGDLTLGGTCVTHQIRGNDPSLGLIITWGSQQYAGADVFVTLDLLDTPTFTA